MKGRGDRKYESAGELMDATVDLSQNWKIIGRTAERDLFYLHVVFYSCSIEAYYTTVIFYSFLSSSRVQVQVHCVPITFFFVRFFGKLVGFIFWYFDLRLNVGRRRVAPGRSNFLNHTAGIAENYPVISLFPVKMGFLVVSCQETDVDRELK